MGEGTNVSHVNLPATTTLGTARWPSVTALEAALHATTKTTSVAASCANEAGFSLAVLQKSVSAVLSVTTASTDLSNVNQTTHKVLIAELIHGLLSLVSCRIFHNSVDLLVTGTLATIRGQWESLPASLQSSEDSAPIRQPNHPSKPQGRGATKESQPNNHAIKPTFDIPLGSSNTSAKRTSPAKSRRPSVKIPPEIEVKFLTLSHKVLEVVPFDVVGKISHVDTAVLLGGLADVGHHLLASNSAILIRALGSGASESWACSSTRCT